MLSVSDNAATNAMIDMVGMDPVNAAGDRLGLTATMLGRTCWIRRRREPAGQPHVRRRHAAG